MEIINELTDEHRAYWADYTCKEHVFTAPAEIEHGIEPATGIITAPREPADLDMPCVRVAWRPNEIDLANLARGGTIWLSCWGGLPPHYLEVQAP